MGSLWTKGWGPALLEMPQQGWLSVPDHTLSCDEAQVTAVWLKGYLTVSGLWL